MITGESTPYNVLGKTALKGDNSDKSQPRNLVSLRNEDISNEAIAKELRVIRLRQYAGDVD